MTREESRLWYGFLRDLPVMVHRPKVIGSYIVDFYIASANVVIELDGSQHYAIEGKLQDEQRDAFMKSQGLTVLRYANSDVNCHFNVVCEDILKHLNESECLLPGEKVPRRGGCGAYGKGTD